MKHEVNFINVIFQESKRERERETNDTTREIIQNKR